MTTRKPSNNPLFAPTGNIDLSDSFGVMATLPVISAAEEDSFVGAPATPSLQVGRTVPMCSTNPSPITPNLTNAGPPISAGIFSTPMAFFTPAAPSLDLTTTEKDSPNTSSPQSVPLTAANTPASPPPPLSTPMPSVIAKPPQFSVQGPSPLIANKPPVHSPPNTLPGIPSVPVGPYLPSTTLKRPTYAPLPYLNSTAASKQSSPGPVYNLPGMPPLPEPRTFTPSSSPQTQAALPPSNSAPSLSTFSPQVPAITAHWFYNVSGDKDVWKPFSVEDSTAIETAFENGLVNQSIPVDGTRYDVNIEKRVKIPAYWKGQSFDIRRCSWFHRSSAEGRWIPYEEEIADKLEHEYQAASRDGRWQCKVVFDNGEWVMLHSPEVMMHFPTSSATLGALDDWGQVQPQSDPSLRPHVVHRGLEGLPDIPDGESVEVDHIVFVVHGIGAACDIKFRPIAEVVDGFRELTEDISAKHFAGAHLASKANRIEFLPVSWHDKLHGEDTGTDSRIQPLTLRSIPKLRSFVNDTLLDVLFYTSPLYCQTILDTVCGEINRMYQIFCSRNPGFGGGCSMVGHSLGSLILFDLLAGQEENSGQPEEMDENVQKPSWDKDLSIEGVFSKLEIEEHLAVFVDQGIGIQELETCSEDDLKEAGLPLGPRKKLLMYLKSRIGAASKSGYAEFQASTVARQVSYNVGPAGTGQPSVRYPKLDVKPTAFFALGSPTGMFMAVRGIDSLGVDFQLPTCNNFYNIFHPYDPVAYRIESLVDKNFCELRPLLVPHHKGRKRMHLELKETMSRVGTDIKQRVMESLKATMGAVYHVAGTLTGQVEQAVETEISEQTRTESPVQDEVLTLPAKINSGKRVDYVLQEAPLESFNEYLFAIASHLCYWESEDISLMILKEIYSSMDITADSELLDKGIDTVSTSIAPSNYQPSSNPGSYTGYNVHQHKSSPPSVAQHSSPVGPPTFFNLDSVPEVPAYKTGVSYPRLNNIPQKPGHFQSPPVMGMDPTAPISMDRPIAPPPTMGFTR